MSAQIFPQNFQQAVKDNSVDPNTRESRWFVKYLPGLSFLVLVLMFFLWGGNHVLDPRTLPIKGNFIIYHPRAWKNGSAALFAAVFSTSMWKRLKRYWMKKPGCGT